VALHSVHKIICERICGFSSPLIDRLIDGCVRVSDLDEKVRFSGAPHFDLVNELHLSRVHDVAGISCSELFEQIEIVYSRFGDKGLCYNVLHHYLDKFSNTLRGQILHTLGLSLSSDPEWIKNEFSPRLEHCVEEGYEMEVSVFTVLEAIVEGNVESFEDLIKYTLRLDRYTRSARRGKRELFIYIWEECRSVLTPERAQLATL